MNENEIFDFDMTYEYIISLLPDEIDVSEIITHRPKINGVISNHHPRCLDQTGLLAEKFGCSAPRAEDIRQETHEQHTISNIEFIVLNDIINLIDNLSLYCTKIRTKEIRKSTVLYRVIVSMRSMLNEKPHKSAYSIEERKIMRRFVKKYSLNPYINL